MAEKTTKLEKDLVAVQKEITAMEKALDKLYEKRGRLITKALKQWSQRKVATILGVSRGAVYKFNRKRRGNDAG